ncbi:hydrogenase maturation protease [Halococcoides cellulosivorans]|uniref:hydrogenase maturation protease n=1 Tax=Halococcoides cellulosivorans TaxID=1679096 RepID=UPI00131EF3D9|nr:hydrogenase maturation protease [Halococcoides cellulosivorans]
MSDIVPSARPLVVLGVGSGQGDDRAGVALVDRLEAMDPPDVTAIAGGVAPENYTGPIREADPRAILVVDAVESGADPGAIGAFGIDDLRMGSISTHSAPPTMLVDFLEGTTDATVSLVGIQPATLDGATLSVPVARAVEALATTIASPREGV